MTCVLYSMMMITAIYVHMFYTAGKCFEHSCVMICDGIFNTDCKTSPNVYN